jgi:hypothetical protein
MQNLLKETIETIQDYEFNWPVDVDYIKTWNDIEIPISLFEKVADREYDNGYGCAEVDQNLMIVMKNGDYFVRDEYDGAESWEYVCVHPTRPTRIAKEYDPFM